MRTPPARKCQIIGIGGASFLLEPRLDYAGIIVLSVTLERLSCFREVFVRNLRRGAQRVNLLPVRFVFTAYVAPCSRVGERRVSLARPETKMTGQPPLELGN